MGGIPSLSEKQVAELEARNGLLQFDLMNELIGTVRQLQAVAVKGLELTAGQFRKVPVAIGGTTHVPPPGRWIGHPLQERVATTTWSSPRTR